MDFSCHKYHCSLIPQGLQLSLILILLSFHLRLTVCYEECIESTAISAEEKLPGRSLKTAWVAKTGGKICAEIGVEKNFARTANKSKWLHGEHVPHIDQTLQSWGDAVIVRFINVLSVKHSELWEGGRKFSESRHQVDLLCYSFSIQFADN